MPPTILLADPDRKLLELLELRCRTEGWEVITAEDGMTAVAMADFAKPDVVCMEVDLPCGSGFSVHEMLTGHDRLQHVPVIFLTNRNDAATRSRCREMGATCLGKGPRIWSRLRQCILPLVPATATPAKAGPQTRSPAPSGDEQLQRIEAASSKTSQRPSWSSAFMSFFRRQNESVQQTTRSTRGHHVKGKNNPQPESEFSIGRPTKSKTPCVLLVEEDVELSTALKCRLEAHGVAVIRAFDGTQGYRTAMRYPVDAILLDYELPNGQGDYVLRRLKETPITKDIPVLMVTSRKDNHLQRRLTAMGAERFLTKPLDFEKLQSALAEYIDVLEQATDLNQLASVFVAEPLSSKQRSHRRPAHA